jgi:release factor glutamine methyltransferase
MMGAPATHAPANAASVRAALKEAMARLRTACVPSHTLAAELLLVHILQRDRGWIYSHADEPLDLAAAEKYFALVARRASGEPTQYLTGHQEFWSLDFEVTPAVLIPRPETDHVIEVALERLASRGFKIQLDTGAPSARLRISDVGTGSGCLAVALAHELPHAEIFATDISAEALEVARRNAMRHGVAHRIHFLQCDLLSGILHGTRDTDRGSGSRSFDLVISNPPYVARSEAATLPREVRDHEPYSALFGGPTGIEIYARLIDQAGSLLCRGGILVLELGYNSASQVQKILESQPGWKNVKVTNDLAGIPRVLAADRAR